MTKKIGIGVVFLAVCLLATTGYCAEGAKIGLVDLQRIIDTSVAGKEALAEIKNSGEKMESELQKKSQNIEEMKKNLERKSMVMSRETREQSERDLRISLGDLKFLNQKYMEDFKRMETRLVNRIKDEVFAIVEEIGKREGFALVLERREAGVLFSPDAMDLTDRIIREYDGRHAKKR